MTDSVAKICGMLHFHYLKQTGTLVYIIRPLPVVESDCFEGTHLFAIWRENNLNLRRFDQLETRGARRLNLIWERLCYCVDVMSDLFRDWWFVIRDSWLIKKIYLIGLKR